MDTAFIAHVSWRLRRFFRHCGALAVVGIGLLAFDAAFYLSAVQPAMEENQVLRERLRALEADPDVKAVESASRHDPQAELAAFYAAMARPHQVPDVLRRLQSAAEDQGLEIEEGEYRPAPDAGGRLLRYHIVLPASGAYPDVRRYLAQMTREVPALALDGIAFQRKHIGDDFLETQIRFTLFVEGQG